MMRRLAALALVFAACATAPPPAPSPIAPVTEQRELKVGMDQHAVTSALGAPTRVSSDSQQREVWTYEEIASERVDTTSSIGGGLIVFAPGQRSLASADQRTLTLIIYYDEQEKVREFAYNYSSAR